MIVDPFEELTIAERFNLLVDIYSGIHSGDMQKAKQEGERLALANARRIVAKDTRAGKKAKDEFEIVVEIAAKVCADKGITPRNSDACAKKIKKHVDAARHARSLPPVGIGRLKRALGLVAAERK